MINQNQDVSIVKNNQNQHSSFEYSDQDQNERFEQNQHFQKAIRHYSLRLNVKKVQNYDFLNLKKTQIIKQIFNNEINNDITQTFQIQQSIIKAQSLLYYAKIHLENQTYSNISEILPHYSNFQENKQFLEMVDNLLKSKQITDQNRSQNQDGNMYSFKQLDQIEQQKYQAVTAWMQNMSPNSPEFFNFYVQIYEVYQGLEQILKQQQDQEKKGVKQDYQNIILLHQNENQKCDTLLHVSSFVQNLLIQNKRLKNSESYHMLYINFTGENQQQHLDFWNFFNYNNKRFSKYISFIPLSKRVNNNEQQIQNENNDTDKEEDYENCFQNLHEQQKIFNRQKQNKQSISQQIFPILYDQALSEQQIQIIYSMFLQPILNSFNPKFIYLDLQVSSQFQFEYNGIEYLLRQLQKQANVIVYLRYKYESSIQNLQYQQNVAGSEMYNSYLNAIVYGISGFKKIKLTTFYDNTPNKIIQWADRMQKAFYQYHKFFENQVLYLKKQISQFDNLALIYDIYQFAIRLQLDFIQWIFPQDLYRSNQSFTSSHCFYDQNIIILFNQNDFSVHSQEIQTIVKYENNSQIQKIFNTLQMPKNLIEPSILVIGKYLIIAYGYECQINNIQFFDGILVFDLNQLEEFDEIKRINKAPSTKIFNSENLLNCIENRRCPQICQNNGFHQDDHYLSFILIGGESIKSNLIMNIIEVVFINLKTKTFCSYALNNMKLSLYTSLKSWPHQIVLEYSIQKKHLYLILTGNDVLKLNPYSFPINPCYHNQSQLLVQQDDSFKLYNILIKRQNQHYFKIEQLYNNSRNWILEQSECTDIQIVWKAYITTIVDFKNPTNCEILNPFKEKFQKQNPNNSYYICIELKIQLLIPNNDHDYQAYTVQMEWKIVSLQIIER
ncbi:unnamed protein product [Paramecium sonneborni]|uniref:Uncharacterized protein n=1 Tax=Paramecium sonneborni TaxID=65129 RepID=A0A8S1LCG0_9CILI|nr:unnamed protein product [Paramecium sonneborni]